MGHGALYGAAPGGGKADVAFPLIVESLGDDRETVALHQGEVAGECGAIHTEDVRKRLVGDGLRLTDGG
jgi:hypothetical protein